MLGSMVARPMVNRLMVNSPMVNRPMVDRPMVDRLMVDRPIFINSDSLISDRQTFAILESLSRLKICYSSI